MFRNLILFFTIALSSFETYQEITEWREKVTDKTVSLMCFAKNRSEFKNHLNIYLRQIQNILDTKNVILNNKLHLLDELNIENTNEESDLLLLVMHYEQYCEQIAESIKNNMVQSGVLEMTRYSLRAMDIPYDKSEFLQKVEIYRQKFVELVLELKNCYSDTQRYILRMKKRLDELKTS